MLLFNIGEIAYLTYGVGERNIQAVIINKINKKTATVETFVGGREFEVSVGALIRDRDLIQEVFDYINNNIKDMKKRELSEAIRNNDIDKVKKLINAGVDVNAKYDDAITPLHYACEYDRPEIADLLINAGANINARDKEGRTALDIAKEENNQKIVDLLKNYNKKIMKKQLFKAVENKDINKVKKLIKNGVDVNARDDNYTTLHIASIYNRPEIAKKLINAGADLDAKDYDGFTALHYAAFDNYPETAKVLIEAKADINARDNNGRTAFDIAKKVNHQKIIDLLKNYNKKTKNYDDRTTIQCN